MSVCISTDLTPKLLTLEGKGLRHSPATFVQQRSSALRKKSQLEHRPPFTLEKWLHAISLKAVSKIKEDRRSFLAKPVGVAVAVS